MASFAFGRRAPEPSGPSEEVQGLYRMLGLAEDATYDEINAAYDALADKYSGEVKRVIKLQVAKDKILEDRLRQRMSGALKSTVAESPWDRPPEKQPLIKIPRFLEPYMELPSKAKLTSNAGIFAMIACLSLLSKTFATSTVTIGFAISIFLLYNRGLPDTGGDMDAEYRPPKVKPLVLSFAFTFLAGAIGASLSTLLFGVLSFLAQEVVVACCTSATFCLSCTFFKVQDEY